MPSINITPLRHPIPRPAHAGFSLIEVLVALLVLSIGLLGLAMLQIQGFKLIGNSYLRTQATIAANDIIDRMRANKEGAQEGDYCLNVTAPIDPCNTTLNPGISNCGDTGGCANKADLAVYDISRWYQQQAKYLPNSGGLDSSISRTAIVGVTGSYEYTITIRWKERDLTMSQEWKVQI